MLYALIGMAIAMAVAIGYAKIEHSGKLEARAELGSCNTKIEAQNLAVQQLKVEGERRIAAATRGVAKAQEGTKKARTEAERLRVLAGTQAEPSACPAAQGVAEIRKGL